MDFNDTPDEAAFRARADNARGEHVECLRVSSHGLGKRLAVSHPAVQVVNRVG